MTKDIEARDGWKLFVHPGNITVGKGRVLFAEAINDGRTVMPAGWVLPGGRRTQDRDEAVAVATEIERITELAAARAARSVR